VSAPGTPAPRGETPERLIWRTFRRNRAAVLGLWVVVAFFLIAIAGIALTKGADPVLDPREVRLPDRLQAPLARPNRASVPAASLPRLGIYLLGTDELGRDVFARMLEGAFVSLSVGFIAVGLAVFIGIVLGGLAGYYGPRSVGLGPVRLLRVDTLITALIDLMLSFPTFFLILTVVAILRPSIWNIMVVIGLTSWEGPARLVRAEILSLREREFVQAAQAAGASGRRMIARHLIPNAVGPVLVSATLGVAGAILIESSLSFLGFGVPPPNATWGNILADGKRFIFDAPWLTLVPGTAILIVVLAFNLFGEGLREAFNPRLREG
jgi:peptide/nickel transport system permease protein